jgi:hypothetical protein
MLAESVGLLWLRYPITYRSPRRELNAISSSGQGRATVSRLHGGSEEAANVPMPSVSVARDRMITGLAHGYAELDWSALGLVAAEEAGIEDRAGAE